MIQVSNLRRGMAFAMNNDIYLVTEYKHMTPGNLRAFVQLSYRSISTGKSASNRFRPSDQVELITLEPVKAQYLYHDRDKYHFMNLEDYSQLEVSENVAGEAKNFMTENMELKLMVHDGNVIEVELPASVALRVTNSPPGVKGDSATNVQKLATLETGYTLNVPLFIKEGEKIQVDTRSGEYLSRA